MTTPLTPDQQQSFENAKLILQLMRQQKEANDCADSLRKFVRAAWPIIGLGSPYVHNWHIDAICLPPQALIQTRKGPVPIVDLAHYSGEVLSWNHDAGRPEWRPISHWMKSSGKDLVRITTASGGAVSLTENHPVYVRERGYVHAGDVRIGETVIVVQAVRESVLPLPVTPEGRVLRNEMLWPKQDPAEETLPGLWRDKGMGQSLSMPGVLSQIQEDRHHPPLSAVRGQSVSNASTHEGKQPQVWRVLWQELLRFIRNRREEPRLLQRWQSGRLPFIFQNGEEVSAGAGGVCVLSVCGPGEAPGEEAEVPEFGRSSYRSRQEEQRNAQSGRVVSQVSQKAGVIDCREVAVCNVEREIPGPDFVYNIEVSSNHNYFADGVLVHNCEHLEAVINRDIRRLIINMPPRAGKSSIVSVALSAWRWISCPTEKFLTASYDLRLAKRDSRHTKNLIKHDWYQKRWGDRFKITADQAEKGHFENDKGGYRIATSTSAGTTGHGGSVRILDDPNNLDTINSKEVREDENSYYKIMSTRHIDAPTDVEICVQQRGHPDDMTGMLIAMGTGWELLTLPNEFEGPMKFPLPGSRDPRTHVGELMHPERIGPIETEDLKKTLGPDYAGQYQQRPATLAGNALKREWWQFWNPRMDDLRPEQRDVAMRPIKIKIGAETLEREAQQIPDAFEQVVQSWDMAFKDLEHNDFVAGHAWGRLGANCYMLARDHGHYDFPKTCAAVRKMSLAYPCPEKLVEDKANGPAVIQSLRNEIPGLLAVNDAGGKIARVNAISGYVEAGNAWLPNPNLYPWVWDLLNEFSDFPAVSHDDDTDAMTQALKRLFDSMATSGLPEFRVQPRVGEPQTACHIEAETEMLRGLPPHWRRWISVAPGHPGCALWLAETPSGSLRVYRELELLGADAFEAGKRIAACSLPDLEAWLGSIHAARHWHIDLLLEKTAFAPVEPVGSYAGLLEQGLLEYEPEKGDWDARQYAKSALKAAKFSAQMALLEESAVDRLRSLLQFAPPNFEQLPYDRAKAFALSRDDINAYTAYMAAVEDRIVGEWPKLKISSQCRNLISALGCARRDEQIDTPDPFLRALLIGVSAPPSVMTKPGITEMPATRIGQKMAPRRRFAMR